MQRRTQKIALVLALAAIALLAFTTTADLLPHHHDTINERVCPICHPPLMGFQPAVLKLPSQGTRSWAVKISTYLSMVASPIRHTSPRAPPSA